MYISMASPVALLITGWLELRQKATVILAKSLGFSEWIEIEVKAGWGGCHRGVSESAHIPLRSLASL